jgi:hypothetical protein
MAPSFVGQVGNLRRVFNPPSGMSTAVAGESTWLRLGAIFYCPSSPSRAATIFVEQVVNPPAGMSTAIASETTCLQLAAMWGRLSACGGFSTRPASEARLVSRETPLWPAAAHIHAEQVANRPPGTCQSQHAGRRVENPPQVVNLPHKDRQASGGAPWAS